MKAKAIGIKGAIKRPVKGGTTGRQARLALTLSKMRNRK